MYRWIEISLWLWCGYTIKSHEKLECEIYSRRKNSSRSENPNQGRLTLSTTIRHHHHHVVPLARISLTLSHHFSLSFIALGRSSELHPVSSHSCCMYVLADRPAFARPYVGVHRSTSLMSSSRLLQQCPAYLVRLTWIVGALLGVTARTYSILVSTFLCNCRLASSPAVLLVSKWCIHIAVSTRLLPGRSCVSFYRSGLISIRSIAYR